MKHNLLKSVIISVILLLGANSVWAGASWIGNSYIVVNGTWYNGSGSVQTAGAFHNKNLGSITSLTLGGEIQTYGQTDGAKNPARMHYQISGKNAAYITLYWFKYQDNNNFFHSNSDGSTLNNNTFASKTIDISSLTPGDYTLSVWFEQPDGGQWDSNNSNNYVASFTIDPVVTFKANGGTGSDYTQTVKYNTATTLTANKFTRTGYSFNGWKTAANSGTSYANQASVKFTSNTTLYAQWTPAKYTITYKDQNNATFSGTHADGHPTTHTYGTATTLSTATKTGYTFEGWYKEATCTNKVTSLGATEYTSAPTLYAKWTPIRCNITLTRGDGATGGSGYVYATYGSNILEPEIVNPTKTGHNFLGWSNQGGNVIVIDINGKLLPDRANGSLITYTDDNGNWAHTGTSSGLWAKWEAAKYNINYKDQGNANFSGTHASGYPTQHTYGKATSLLTATKTGYTFEGWFKNPECTGSAVTTLGSYAYSDDITLYAKWTANKYTVTLDNQSATTTGTASVQATYGSAMPSATMPQKTGYTFGGYYTAISGGGTKYYNANGSSAKNWDKTAATTLYAKWTANQYTITYKDQGDVAFSGTHASGKPTTHTYGTATTLKDATKTGYTFGGWHTDQACTQKVTSLGATAYTANITLYAKWTINQYTLTFGAGEGGSVTATAGGKPITSPATINHGTSVTLEATPSGENAFAQWVNGNGNQISTKNPYELTITGTTSIKAEFTSPSRVYLKPYDFWKSDGARIAAYYWGAAGNNWIELSPVDCEGHYYSVDIPAGYSNIIFARLKPSTATGYVSTNNGFNWDNSWNQTADLTVQTNGKNLYNMHIKDSRIYLKPNSNWKTDGARFAAFFKVNADNNDGGKWMSMFQLDSDNNYYWCDLPTDQNYIKVIFCRMKGTDATNNWGNKWDESKQLDIQTNENNCFTINDGDWNNAEGSWSCYQYNNKWTAYSTPTYDVTIKPTIHGTYSVVCNGRTYPVSYKEDIVIPNVPLGTTLQIKDVKPGKSSEYTADIIYKESTNAAYQALNGDQITVCGNTTIDENFVTKNAHVVYLRIPSGLNWGTGNYQKLSVYNKLTESYVPTVMTAAPNASNYETGYTYYTCTIPAGTHTIRFEYNNQYQTHDFPHVMPLGSLNCYTIHSREGETKVFNGYWSELLSNGDYRLLYVEQTVEKDANNKTIIKRRKAHPSDIIPASIISAGGSKVVSLHIFKDRTYTDAVKKYDGGTPTYYESNNNPEVILQQYNRSTNTWEDKECHMVFGPLKTLPGMAMAPGRRNTAADGELVYDDGIEIIKNDDHQVHPGSGVWNFTVKQLEGNKATIDLTNVTRYTGEYYIRTDVANGGWFNYNPTNHMTRSDEAKANSNFSHYYCKWIESNNNVNVKFTVANDFGYAISDTLEADRTDLWGVALANKMVGDNQTLPTDANVRFAWNEYSNFIHRAYIAGSAVVRDRFLVLEGDANIFDADGNALKVSGLDNNQQIFRDNSNWIYYADVQMKPMAPVKVTAKYNDQTQYFIGKQNETVTLLQGSGSEKYLIRMLYDFKTNQLISAYVPGASNSVNAISTNLMLIRQNNNEATQLEFNNAAPHDMETIPTDRRAYGVIEFTKERLIDDQSLNAYQRSLYWISFPFDVNVEGAICFGEYGKHWIIQEYNGARRAAEGCWLDSESFWDYKWDQKNITLEAGKGYVLALDVDQIRTDDLFGLAGNRPIGIYFPSTSYIDRAIMDLNQVSTTVKPLECTINRNTPKGDRRIADSHWNVIGVPSYRNTSATYSFADIATKPTEVKYYYRWDGNYNAYTAMETTGTQDFHSTHAYMVQFAGQINWKNIFNIQPAAIAAKQSSDDIKEHRLRLEIQQNGNKADHTFVRLQDEDGVTDHFDFNHDLCKIINAGANIYSFVTTETYPIEVAANVLPIQETIIPVGIKLDAAGEYTFAMPDGTDGIVVELIDYETNTRTNMLLDNYTVNLGKGTFDNRFALHVQPSKVTTSVGDINTNSNGVKKYLIDCVLYMQKDGVLYDAQGKLVR